MGRILSNRDRPTRASFEAPGGGGSEDPISMAKKGIPQISALFSYLIVPYKEFRGPEHLLGRKQIHRVQNNTTLSNQR